MNMKRKITIIKECCVQSLLQRLESSANQAMTISQIGCTGELRTIQYHPNSDDRKQQLYIVGHNKIAPA